MNVSAIIPWVWVGAMPSTFCRAPRTVSIHGKRQCNGVKPKVSINSLILDKKISWKNEKNPHIYPHIQNQDIVSVPYSS